MKYFKYLDLPPLDRNLLLQTEDEFSSMENIFRKPDYPYYRQYTIPNQELTNKIQELFPFEILCSYQLVRNGIAIHKDGARTECVNYLIDTGGKFASTNIFDDNQRLLHSEIILPERWHWIDVGMFHNVTNFTGTRISITVNPVGFSYKAEI